jgi:hypothetical protein
MQKYLTALQGQRQMKNCIRLLAQQDVDNQICYLTSEY